MATKIITKNSSTATSIPTAGDLVQGELAVNVTDKRLFTEDSGGAIVELGTNPSTLTSGAATFSGDVGIGASPTNGRLHVKAASGVLGWFETTGLSGALGISNSGTYGMQIDTASSSGFLTFTKGSGSTEFGRFDTNGNFGLGNSLPVSKLDIASGNVTISNSSNAPFINFVDNTTRSQSLARITMDQLSGTAGQLLFSTTTGSTLSERLRIGSDGQLTSSVAGGVFKTRADGGGLEYTQLLDVATAGCTIFGKTNRGDVASISLYQTATGADGGYIKFNTSSSGSTTPSEKMRLDASGNLGLGMVPSAWSANTHIIDFGSNSTGYEGTVGDFGGLMHVAQNMYYGTDYQRKETGYASRFYQYQSEFVWQNAGYATGGSSIAWNTRMVLDSSGMLAVPAWYTQTTALGATAYIASGPQGAIYRSTSSIKYKRDVETMEDAYADALLDVRPVFYRSKSDKDNESHGFWGIIAEELAEIDPRLVHWQTHVPVEVTDDDGVVTTEMVELDTPEPEGVQYERFVPHLINLAKRQRDQMTAQASAIEALTARIEALEGA